MIRNSFIFLEGVSVKTEYNLWNAGIKNWSDFVGTNKIKGISA